MERQLGPVPHTPQRISGRNDPMSTQPNSGLGRNLAGILGDAFSARAGTGVNQLLGGETVRSSPVVRELVTQLALRSIAEGFSADGVILVRRDGAGEMAAVTSQLPSSWDGFDAISFEVSGRLWQKLDASAYGHAQFELGGSTVLMCHDATGEGSIAAAVVRAEAFDENECETVGNLIRSIGSALSGDDVLPADASVRVLTQNSGDGVLADIRLSAAGDRRDAASVAETHELSVARAASELCDEPLVVEFAGGTVVDGFRVTIVVVRRHDGGPLFGLAVTEEGASNGPALAVFSAARVIGVDPFSGVRHRQPALPLDS